MQSTGIHTLKVSRINSRAMIVCSKITLPYQALESYWSAIVVVLTLHINFIKFIKIIEGLYYPSKDLPSLNTQYINYNVQMTIKICFNFLTSEVQLTLRDISICSAFIYITLIGPTYLEPLMVPIVTWLSSNWVMMSSAPAMINVSRPGWARYLKSVFFHKSTICNIWKDIHYHLGVTML